MTILLTLLTILINLIIQSTVLPHFEIFGTVPNTALIMVIVLALARGKYYGGLYGLIIGLLQDVLFSMTIGINALIFFLAGYFIGFVEDTFARDNVVNPVIFTALGTIYYNIFYSLFMYFLSSHITFNAAVKSVFSVEVIYNCIVSVFIYKLFQIIFSEPKIRFSKR